MSRTGIAPWQNDIAADWFGDLFAITKLREHVIEALHQDGNDPVEAEQIRAACFLLICLGRTFMWPIDHIDDDLGLALQRLEQCIHLEESIKFKEIMEKELLLLRLSIENEPTHEKEMELMSELWNNYLAPRRARG
ncbi:MAG: hypothetical protein SGJ27_03320 [Candidatus Melainabacteria bacterium]|nr:hypothetical protein [Candidatus Melainabacteria bacterium]